jgi:hypothetical protein
MRASLPILALTAALAIQAPGEATGAEQAALRQADDGLFAAADLNGDGKISRREHIHFADLVFLSMDADGDGSLTPAEFLAWDPGYIQAAEQAGRTKALADAKEDVFEELDLNDDKSLDHDEMSAASLRMFYQADTDRNRVLSRKEFFEEFYIVKTVRDAVD